MYDITLYYDEDDDYAEFDYLGDIIIKEPYDDMSTVSFSSDNTNVIEIDKKGKMTFKDEGTAILTATCGDITLKLRVNVKKI